MIKVLDLLNDWLEKTLPHYFSKFGGTTRKYWRVILLVFFLLLLALIIDGIVLQSNGWGWASWTGLGEYTRGLPKDDRPKTLWDLLQLLIIPAALSVGALIFNASQKKREQDIATDKQKEDALQAYFKEIGRLMIETDLLKTKEDPNSPFRSYAQVLTITTLRNLGTFRKNILLQFLRDSRLGDFILIEASLQEFDFYKARLANINLSKAFMVNANLSESDLNMTNLSEAMMVHANLRSAYMAEANLTNANLSEADLCGALLTKANLSDAVLWMADLSYAHLDEAILNKADFWGAVLRSVNLRGADLSGVDFNRVGIMTGTIMPDGTIHE